MTVMGDLAGALHMLRRRQKGYGEKWSFDGLRRGIRVLRFCWLGIFFLSRILTPLPLFLGGGAEGGMGKGSEGK